MEVLVANLADSVTGLQKLVGELQTENSSINESMSQLQQDNEALRQDLKTKASTTDLTTLQQNSGVGFRRFRELPPELRR
jgi:peptidoglycan hydrolase CwlO-like protein